MSGRAEDKAGTTARWYQGPPITSRAHQDGSASSLPEPIAGGGSEPSLLGQDPTTLAGWCRQTKQILEGRCDVKQ
jgi:hypothetical protein